PPRPTLFPYTTLFRSLELVLVGPHERARGEVGDHPDVVLLELVALQLEHPPRLVRDRARAPFGRVVTGEQQQVLDDARRAPRFLDRKSTRLNSSHDQI